MTEKIKNIFLNNQIVNVEIFDKADEPRFIVFVFLNKVKIQFQWSTYAITENLTEDCEKSFNDIWKKFINNEKD